MEERRDGAGGWRRLRVFLGLAGVAFAVTLAVIVGNRLSDEAMAVLAGAVCGVGAAIPTSLLIVSVSRRRDEEQGRTLVPVQGQGAYGQPQDAYPQAQGPYPPVVIVTPQSTPHRSAGWDGLPPSLVAPVQRTFTVVGGGSSESGGEFYERHS